MTWSPEHADDERPSPDLVQRVMAAAAPELTRLRRRAWMRRLALPLAAAALLVLVLSLRERNEGPPSRSEVARHGEWLQSGMGSDGGWNAVAWRGPPADEVGMHAMALLALASVEVPDLAGRRQHLLQGAGWLLRRQYPDGSVGRPLPSGAFDHPVGTLALLETWRVTGDELVHRSADRAVAHLVEHAESVAAPAHNAGLSAWTLQALLRAQELGWPSLEGPIAHGRQRLLADLAPGQAGGPLDLPAVRALALGQPDARQAQALGPLYAASVAILDG